MCVFVHRVPTAPGQVPGFLFHVILRDRGQLCLRSQWPQGQPPGDGRRQHRLPGWGVRCTGQEDLGEGEGGKRAQVRQEEKTKPGEQLWTEQSQKVGRSQNELTR